MGMMKCSRLEQLHVLLHRRKTGSAKSRHHTSRPGGGGLLLHRAGSAKAKHQAIMTGGTGMHGTGAQQSRVEAARAQRAARAAEEAAGGAVLDLRKCCDHPNQTSLWRRQTREAQVAHGVILSIAEHNSRQADHLQNQLQVSKEHTLLEPPPSLYMGGFVSIRPFQMEVSRP